jgi:hypothetical protein
MFVCPDGNASSNGNITLKPHLNDMGGNNANQSGPQLISISGHGQNGHIQLVHVNPGAAHGMGTNHHQQLIRINPAGGHHVGIPLIHVDGNRVSSHGGNHLLQLQSIHPPLIHVDPNGSKYYECVHTAFATVLRYVGAERSVASACDATMASRYTPDSTGWRPGVHAGIQPYALPPYTDMVKCFEECWFTIGACTKYRIQMQHVVRCRLYGRTIRARTHTTMPILQLPNIQRMHDGAVS